ncbi:MAG: hypothetical protein ACOCV2_03525, partial [Persicimonas sp.]
MHAFVSFCQRRVTITLAVLAVLTGLAVWAASDLRLDSDLERLLPKTAPSVQGLDELDRVYGGQIGTLTIVFEADDSEADNSEADNSEADNSEADNSEA